MSKKVINLPVKKPQQVPQENEINLDDIEVPEVDDMDYAEMYAPPKDYVCNDRCYKCGHVFDDNEQIWYINQLAGYGSQLDGSTVSIKICDSCLSNFIK